MTASLSRPYIDWMKTARFYPHDAATVEHRQTHISDVFLAGDVVYKLKKPVDTGFLDFTTLAKRREFCRREVALNRRLSSGVYLGVETITRDGEEYRLNGAGDVVDYAVKMRRLPEENSLQAMLSADRVEESFLDRLTDLLADFYRRPELSDEQASAGEVEQVLENCRENFSELQAFTDIPIDEEKMEVIRAATESFVNRHEGLFLRRVEEGRICDCHGDLKTEHVYDTDGVQIIDCIEFNDRFRFQDPAADLAFLAMDMDFLQQPSAGQELLSRYVSKSGDWDLMRLVDFYKCYRAMVQAKVLGLRLETLGAEATGRQEILQGLETYVNLGYHYGVKMMQPVLWVFCGLTATGKSTIAARMAELFAIPWIRSDHIRKEIFKGNRQDSRNGFGEGMYSATATSLVYGRMLLAAQEELQRGQSVVVDATYRHNRYRQDILELAEDCHASIIFVECQCGEEEVKRRLKQREQGGAVSDARLQHWENIKATSDGFIELPSEKHITLSTEQPVKRCLEDILAGMYELLAKQVSYLQV